MTLTIYQIIAVLYIHYVFDFCLQTHWQASNKSKSNVALASHVGVYTIGLSVMALFCCLSWVGVLWVIINAVLHFITDYITSRKSSKLFNVNWHDFFEVIGLDQMIHYITLFTTLAYISNL